MQVAQAMAGYTMAEAEDLRRAMGKKVKAAMRAQRGEVRRRVRRPGLHARLWAKHCSTRSSRSPGTGSTGPTPPATGSSPTRPRGSRPTTRPSTWRRCSPPPRGTRSAPRSTSPSAAPWDVRGARARRQRVADGLLGARGEDPVRSFGRPQRRRGGGREDHRSGRADGPFAHFHDFADRVDPLVLNKRTVESLIKAGAFDGMGHSGRSLILVYEQCSRRPSVAGATRRWANTRCSAAIPRGRARWCWICPRGSGPKGQARLREGDARSLRLRPPAARRGHDAPPGTAQGARICGSSPTGPP